METPSFRNTFMSTFIKYCQSFAQICNGNVPIDWKFFSHSIELECLKPKETFSEPVVSYTVGQGSSNLAHEIHFPAEFSSNPNQTHLSMLISDYVYMDINIQILIRLRQYSVQESTM